MPCPIGSPLQPCVHSQWHTVGRPTVHYVAPVLARPDAPYWRAPSVERRSGRGRAGTEGHLRVEGFDLGGKCGRVGDRNRVARSPQGPRVVTGSPRRAERIALMPRRCSKPNARCGHLWYPQPAHMPNLPCREAGDADVHGIGAGPPSVRSQVGVTALARSGRRQSPARTAARRPCRHRPGTHLLADKAYATPPRGASYTAGNLVIRPCPLWGLRARRQRADGHERWSSRPTAASPAVGPDLVVPARARTPVGRCHRLTSGDAASRASATARTPPARPATGTRCETARRSLRAPAGDHATDVPDDQHRTATPAPSAPITRR